MKTSKKLYLSAFTLVELIVVIVILAILATIAFLSFNSYSSSSRDSVRLADVANLNKGIELYNVKSGYYPLPNGVISSGTIFGVEVTYKGIVGDNISKLANINKTPIDPLSSSNYVYGISYDKKYFQIGVVLENSSNKTGYNYNDDNQIENNGIENDNFIENGKYIVDNNNSIPLLTSPNLGEELISSIFPLTRGNTRGLLFDIEKTYSASGAGNYFSRIKGNYNGIIKFSSGTTNKNYYIANIPSLIYNDSNPNLLNTGVYYNVNNNTNLPYQIDSTVTMNNKTADTIIKEVTNKSNATLTGVDITSIVNFTGTTTQKTILISNLFTGSTLDSFGGDIGSVTASVSNGGISSSASGEGNNPVNGVCGSANGKTYLSTDTSYGSDVQCSSGNSSNTSFPGAGGSVSWICNGINGGTNSSSCSANRTNPPLGTSSSNPGTSCLNILQTNGTASDGVYRINPSGTTFQVYCDMTANGGGWTKFDCLNDPRSSINKVSATNTTSPSKYDGNIRSTAGGAGGWFYNGTVFSGKSYYRIMVKPNIIGGGPGPACGFTFTPVEGGIPDYRGETNYYDGIYISPSYNSVGDEEVAIFDMVAGTASRTKNGSSAGVTEGVATITKSASDSYYFYGPFFVDSGVRDINYSCWYK